MQELIKQHFKLILASFAIGVLLVSSVVSYSLFQKTSANHQQEIESTVLGIEFIQPSPISFDQLPKTLTVALLGSGGAGHEGGHLTDVIQLLHINFEAKHVALVSIPRDLWVPLPTGSFNKVNAVLASDTSNPPYQQLKSSLSAISGMQVDYVISIDFVGFQRAIGETLGGINVEVTERLDDPWYPIRGEELNPCGHSPEEIAELSRTLSGFELEKAFACRYERVHFEPGTVVMHGGDALKYVRSRHSSSDFARSQRQQDILQGVKKKILSMDGLQKLPELFIEFDKNTDTDLSIEVVKFLVPALQMAADYNTLSVVLSTENVLQSSKGPQGQFILIPKKGQNNWQDVQSFIETSLNK